ANFLTGLHVKKTTGQDLNAGGVSVDQAAANHVGHLTPLPSLELATDPVVNGLDRAVNYTRMYGSYISWERPDLPLPRLLGPRAAFERMFGPRDEAGRPLPQPSRADDRGLLEAALDDAHDLSRKLGRADKQKLEEYLDAVRGVERRLGYSAGGERGRPPTPPERLTPPPRMDRPGGLVNSRGHGGDGVATPGGEQVDPPRPVR